MKNITSLHTTPLMHNKWFTNDNLSKAHNTDAGYDIKSAEYLCLPAGKNAIVNTGLFIAIPVGYVGFVRGRSGLAFKHNIVVFEGTIDASYRGECKVKIFNLGDTDYVIERGDKIAQMVLVKCCLESFMEVNVLPLPLDDRGDKGFGSSGK